MAFFAYKILHGLKTESKPLQVSPGDYFWKLAQHRRILLKIKKNTFITKDKSHN